MFPIKWGIIAVSILWAVTITGCTPVTEDEPGEPAADEADCETVNVFSDPAGEASGKEPSEASPGKLEPLPEAPSIQEPGIVDRDELKVIADGDYLLALVTKETTLPSDYEPDDLRPVPDYMYPSRDMKLRKEALDHLIKLWHAAEQDEVILHILSAYRSYDYQKGLFQSYAERHGEEAANRFSARPGQSEHQLGTTVDFGGTPFDLTADFADTEQGRWLAENAHHYGFALSYPESKEHITGYVFEPWHYRYIGVDAAVEWKESGQTLKEYLETKPQYFD